MRKIDPQSVWEDFNLQLQEQDEHYIASWAALSNGNHRKIATENYALTIGVMFEGFANDLIFAYANRDCSQVMSHLNESVKASFRGNVKVERAFDKFAEFKSRQHLSASELRDILDPEGRNTSFPKCEAIEARAKQWLAIAHRNKFTNLNAKHRAIIDVVIAVRNNLAHRSKSSLDRLNDTLLLGPLYETGLQRNVNRVQQAGHFLKSRPNGGENTRADILGLLLCEAAHELVG